MTRHKAWLFPILAFLLITPLLFSWDMGIARYFHEKSGEQFASTPILDFIYVYGLLPGQLLGIISLFILIGSYIFRSLKPWRPHALYLVLVLSVGAGIIVHAALKDHWGRPRPREVIEFGGKAEFRPYYKPNFSHPSDGFKSFSCGHCSMGFYFFTLILLGRRLSKTWVVNAGIWLSLILGLSLSYTRMAQGGHFLSDILATALIMWLTALAFDRIIYGEQS